MKTGAGVASRFLEGREHSEGDRFTDDLIECRQIVVCERFADEFFTCQHVEYMTVEAAVPFGVVVADERAIERQSCVVGVVTAFDHAIEHF